MSAKFLSNMNTKIATNDLDTNLPNSFEDKINLT